MTGTQNEKSYPGFSIIWKTHRPISNEKCPVQCLTHDFIHLTVVFYIIHTPAEYVKMKHIGPNILSLLTHEVVIKWKQFR